MGDECTGVAIARSNANKVMRVTAMMLYIVVVIVMMVCRGVDGDASEDQAECGDQLVGLATCLPYVQGLARVPTPDCCQGLKQVLGSSKKCLCVIIKDGNDPQLGLNINATLALGLPSTCQAPANVSQCPALLHLDPHSPEAQVFYQYGSKQATSSGSGHVASSPSPSVLGGPASAPAAAAAASGGFTASAPQGSDAMEMKTGPAITIITAGCAFLIMWSSWPRYLAIP